MDVSNRPSVLLGVLWSQCGLATLCTAARFYTRIVLEPAMGWDDWSMLAALVRLHLPQPLLRALTQTSPGAQLCSLWFCDRLGSLRARGPSKHTQRSGRTQCPQTSVDLPTICGHLPYSFSRISLDSAHPALSTKDIHEMDAHCVGGHQRYHRCDQHHLDLHTMLTHAKAMGSGDHRRKVHQPQRTKGSGPFEGMQVAHNSAIKYSSAGLIEDYNSFQRR